MGYIHEFPPPFDYPELRTEIHKIFADFWRHQRKMLEAGEYDWEWMEYRTDDILRLIQRQGGKISTYDETGSN